MHLNYHELQETRQKEMNSPKNDLLDFLLREPEPLWHCVNLFTVFSTCLDCFPGYLQIYESLDRHSPAIAAILSPPKLSFSSKQSVLFTHQPLLLIIALLRLLD